ncbi:MFS transporter [Galactobacter caseinivorans]|uniref:MFS transporter n=1 Tax=Galactobacter caseinivorans TaxID=2676123 RepID=A0A496PIZ0_9MICC|nr:MFS transporter [Galactobacter caseinivorans]RKW70437.1 MFS transporter [Galactobacter caseinivorans]
MPRPRSDAAPAQGRSPWLWVLVGAAVFTQTGLNLLRPVTSYKLLDFGADATAIGIATAAYAVIPLVVAVWMGRLSDRVIRLRFLLLAGAVLLGLGGAGLAVAPGLAGVIVASTVLGFGHLLFTIAGQSSIARYSAPHQLDAGFGWFTAAYSTGQLLGPLAGGLLLGGGGVEGRADAVNLALWVGAVVAAAGGLLLIAPLPGSPRDRRTESPGPAAPGTADPGTADPAAQGTGNRAQSGGGDQPPSGADRVLSGAAADPGKPTVWRILRIPGLPSIMLGALSLLAMLDILTAFLPVVGEELGVGPEVVGFLLAMRAGASIVCRSMLPWLVRRFSRRRLMLWCLFGAGVTLALPPLALAWWPGLAGVIVAGALLVVGGFFLGIGQPLSMSAISQSVPGSWRGSALAVRLMGNRAGQVAMPLLAGLVAAPWGPAGAIWLSCALLGWAGWAEVRRPRSDTT